MRICSTDETFNLHSGELYYRFLAKAYEKMILDDCKLNVKDIDRKSLLMPRTVPSKISCLVFCHHIFEHIPLLLNRNAVEKK